MRVHGAKGASGAPVHLPPSACNRGKTQLPCLRKPYVCRFPPWERGTTSAFAHGPLLVCCLCAREGEPLPVPARPPVRPFHLHGNRSRAAKGWVGSFRATIRFRFAKRGLGGTRFRRCEPVRVPLCAKTFFGVNLGFGHAAPVRVLLLCINGGHKRRRHACTNGGYHVRGEGTNHGRKQGMSPVQRRKEDREVHMPTNAFSIFTMFAHVR
ncbi:hypothetical protein EDB92DRAFT_1841171 [Lactarius akahatsu]|uniref:Uncharacterized protein n=1 Tax=Lactarius akahatsu TaxID=416441 RepID=A0AAD4LN50_9AGAM|nr:hypothetical protein EDB92DRAFT_1841171 [Lactarius akahatsu]